MESQVDLDVVQSVFDDKVWHVTVGDRYVSLIHSDGPKELLLDQLDPDKLLVKFANGEEMWDTELEIIAALS